VVLTKAILVYDGKKKTRGCTLCEKEGRGMGRIDKNSPQGRAGELTVSVG